MAARIAAFDLQIEKNKREKQKDEKISVAAVAVGGASSLSGRAPKKGGKVERAFGWWKPKRFRWKVLAGGCVSGRSGGARPAGPQRAAVVARRRRENLRPQLRVSTKKKVGRNLAPFFSADR